MFSFTRKPLSNEQLKGFENYKYSSLDTSPLSNYVSHPFWNWLVKFYPEWLAPNVLTLTGFLLCMFSYFVICIYDYNLDANSELNSTVVIPDWVWLLCAVCTFTAHTFDGTDGKQARRTGSSGPIGELFDHGLDSWSTVPFTITIFSAFGRGEFSVSPFRLLCILIGSQTIFISSHWEKYNTGILYLPWSYDLSQFGLVAFYLLCYFVGCDSLKFYVFPGISFGHCLEASFYVCCICSVVVSVYNICVTNFALKTGSQRNLFDALMPLFPCCSLFLTAALWAKFSSNNIVDLDPRAYFWTMGTVFSNIACQLIVAQMSSTLFEPFNLLLVFYIMVATACVFGKFSMLLELFVLRAFALFSTLAHLYYGVTLVQQLCTHFKVEAFSLNYLRRPRNS